MNTQSKELDDCLTNTIIERMLVLVKHVNLFLKQGVFLRNIKVGHNKTTIEKKIGLGIEFEDYMYKTASNLSFGIIEKPFCPGSMYKLAPADVSTRVYLHS